MRDKMSKNMIDHLKSLASLNHIPMSEFEWLCQHGAIEQYQPGLIASKGSKIDSLWIILKGHISVRIDRGAGPKVANTELYSGSVTGMLPYSRLTELPGDTFADQKTEIFSLSAKYFQEMIKKCPTFTAHAVHSMIDRARIHNTSAMLDEKMISIGRLAAGLAHELNNPASVALRDAKLLQKFQTDADITFRMLNKMDLNEEHFEKLESVFSSCRLLSDEETLSPLQKSDLQDEISDWLEHNHLDINYASQLADLQISTRDLDELLTILSKNTFEPALQWIIARGNLKNLTFEIEQSTKQIYRLVDAVKKFTHMDSLAELELVDVGSGISNVIQVLTSKVKSKKADLKLKIEKDLPKVQANGAKLEQVWFNIIDNALDAINEFGKIQIYAQCETHFLSVRIIDDGPGIPSEIIDKIFDPFYTTKSPGQGTGLGLDLSRRLVRANNGDIFVRSKPGETEFCVKLQMG
jgi:signal transduction histidine kinase